MLSSLPCNNRNYAFRLNCLLVTKLLPLKTASLSDLVSFALTLTTSYNRKESRVESSFSDHSSAKEIFTQKFELLGFQIKHQIN